MSKSFDIPDNYINGTYIGDLYVHEEMESMGSLFENCAIFIYKYFNVNISKLKFVETFMTSHIRKLMDEWHPRLMSQYSSDTIKAFVEVDLNNKDFHKIQGEDYEYYHENELRWIGMMYAYMRNEEKISSVELYKKYDLEFMRHFYVWGHQMSFSGAYNRLKNY